MRRPRRMRAFTRAMARTPSVTAAIEAARGRIEAGATGRNCKR